MGIFEKIELFNKLREEIEEVYGSFDTIEIVDEYTDGLEVNSDGIHYYNTDGCEEHTPYCIVVKRGD